MSNILDLYKKLYSDPAKYNDAVSQFGAAVIEQIPAESLAEWASNQPDSSEEYGTNSNVDWSDGACATDD